MPTHVTVSTVQSLSNKTFTDSLSVVGVVYASGGNSVDWNNVYSSVNSNSSFWDASYTNFSNQSANNISVYTTVTANSSNWNTSYTTLCTISAASIAGSIGITIDGASQVITTGSKGSISIPYSCTINSVTMVADVSGSIVIDIFKSNYAGYPTATSICAAALPTITNAFKSTDSTLTGWTKTITSGDVLQFSVSSVSTITKLTLTLSVTKY